MSQYCSRILKMTIEWSDNYINHFMSNTGIELNEDQSPLADILSSYCIDKKQPAELFYDKSGLTKEKLASASRVEQGDADSRTKDLYGEAVHSLMKDQPSGTKLIKIIAALPPSVCSKLFENLSNRIYTEEELSNFSHSKLVLYLAFAYRNLPKLSAKKLSMEEFLRSSYPKYANLLYEVSIAEQIFHKDRIINDYIFAGIVETENAGKKSTHFTIGTHNYFSNVLMDVLRDSMLENTKHIIMHEYCKQLVKDRIAVLTQNKNKIIEMLNASEKKFSEDKSVLGRIRSLDIKPMSGSSECTFLYEVVAKYEYEFTDKTKTPIAPINDPGKSTGKSFVMV